MERLSLAKFAASHGAGKTAATKWRVNGALVMIDGLVDVAASDAKMKSAGLGRFGKQAGQGASTRARKARTASTEPVDRNSTDEQMSDFMAGRDRERVLSKVDAETIKENALARKHLLAVQQASGELVEIEIVEKALFETSRRARDAWTNWPSRIAPLIAADLNIEPERILDLLTAHVHQQLADLGEPDTEFAGES